MKKKLTLLLTILILGSAAACAESLTIKRYELNLNDFNSLEIVDGINVDYKCSEDSAGFAVFETTKTIADQIIFENNQKGKLTIEKQFHAENEMVWGLPTITVYSKFLNKATNSGDSTVRVLSVAPTPEFKAEVIGNGRLVIRDIDCTKFSGSIKTGNGQLVVSGKCDSATLSNTGVGAIQADALEAKNASCRFFGTGTTGVWAVESLTIKGMLPGKLYYKGTPKKIRNYGMGVKIYPFE